MKIINPWFWGGVLHEEEQDAEFWTGEVPLYRSYGVTRRRGSLGSILTWATYVLGYVLAALLVVCLTALVVMAVVAMALYGSTLLRTLLFLGVAIAILFHPVRFLLKRFSLMRRMKKLCEQRGFQMNRLHRFWKTVFSPKRHGVDLVIETDHKRYMIRILQFYRYQSKLTFSDPGKMVLTTRLISSSFHIIFGIKPRVRQKTYSFPKFSQNDNKKAINAFLLNPVPKTLEAKDRDGVIAVTGTGATLLDGTVIFSGSGLLSTLKRET